MGRLLPNRNLVDKLMLMWYAWPKSANLKVKQKSMDSQKQQVAERIKQANNILVTVSSNPSVDQLAACIGLTLTLNKMGKHATAVFSGAVPSTIEFLQPEKTIEKNTDSLRDFIIALDKSKADKLRYKVEDRVVKIFITPYRTSISEKDLEFSQGDFNVDVVLALGVHNQADLDQAITSHGRILHDATVVTINVKPGGELGSLNWLDPAASSLSELGVQLVDMLDKKLIDGQISTALLTGIVAETERFSNAQTSPQTMSISAELMAAGANQQLVATKLEEPVAPPPPPPSAPIAAQDEGASKLPEDAAKKPDDGTLEISHDDKSSGGQENQAPEEGEQAKMGSEEQAVSSMPQAEEPPQESVALPQPPAIEEKREPVAPQIHIDEHGSLSPLEDMLPPKAPSQPPTIIRHSEGPKMVLEPPTLGGQLTASAAPGLGEAQETGGLPQLDQMPSAPSIGQTVMPPTNSDDDESPSGGAAPSDSFLVGTGQPTAPAITMQPQPTIVSPAPVDQLPAADGQLPGVDRTLSDIERDVHSTHLDQTPAGSTDPVSSTPGEAMLPPLSSDAPAQPSTAFDPSNFSVSPPQNDTTSGVTPPSFGQPQPPVADDPLISAQQGAADVVAPQQETAPDLNSARDAVAQAIGSSSSPSIEPIQALNAQPVNLPMGNDAQQPVQPWTPPVPEVVEPPVVPQPSPMPQFSLPTTDLPNPGAPDMNTDPNAPPPVPPPMMPPTNPY